MPRATTATPHNASWSGVALPSIEKRWSIAVYGGRTPLDWASGHWPPLATITAQDVTDVPAWLVADPFMIRENGLWCMFFEVLRSDTRRGEIGLATSADGRHWAYDRIVLREPFHLSFPYVFRWHDTIFMVPETQGRGEVRLYRAQRFPTQWQLEHVLLRGLPFTDSCLLPHGDRWWLLTSLAGDQALLAFHGPSPLGPWTPHDRNPVVVDVHRRVRAAGRPVTIGDRLIRFVQDNGGGYGRRVLAHHIAVLTPHEYIEHPVGERPVLTGTGHGWNAHGMHHIDPHVDEDGRWTAAVDGFRRSWMFGYRRWPPRPIGV